MTPFPMIYTVAQQREDEVRRAAHQESRMPMPLLPRWWRRAPTRPAVPTRCAPAPIHKCGGEQSA